MVGRYFEPDEKICLIFSNEDYSKLRESPVYGKTWVEHDTRYRMFDNANEFMYPDMPQATKWADEFEEGIKKYGFSAEQIQRYKNFDWRTINYLFSDEVRKQKI